MGKKKSKKVPKSATSAPQSKKVKIPHSQHQLREGKPSWRFSTADKSGPFAWPKGRPEEAEIIEKLHSFDSMTWADIEGKKHHFLSVTSLSKEAITRLEKIQRDDEYENLFSFHLQGKPRIICIRHNDVAQLLWHDPEHKVAPSKKKGT